MYACDVAICLWRQKTTGRDEVMEILRKEHWFLVSLARLPCVGTSGVFYCVQDCFWIGRKCVGIMWLTVWKCDWETRGNTITLDGSRCFPDEDGNVRWIYFFSILTRENGEHCASHYSCWPRCTAAHQIWVDIIVMQKHALRGFRSSVTLFRKESRFARLGDWDLRS